MHAHVLKEKWKMIYRDFKKRKKNLGANFNLSGGNTVFVVTGFNLFSCGQKEKMVKNLRTNKQMISLQ